MPESKRRAFRAYTLEEVLERATRNPVSIPPNLADKAWRFSEDPEVLRMLQECAKLCKDRGEIVDEDCLLKCLGAKGAWRIARERYGIK